MNTITTRTETALEANVLEFIKNKSFCIVGCGAVGVAFAEILVRTGALKISLIDGDKVEITNLNRMVGFLHDDVGKNKVDVLANHLKRINPNIVEPVTKAYHFKERFPGDNNVQEVRDLVVDSDVILIAMDKNSSRILCENLCKQFKKDYISIGIRVDKEKGEVQYECSWKPKTLEEKKDVEGYGPVNGSFASIIFEATAVGFHLMLHHLRYSEHPEYKGYKKEYLNFKPRKVLLKLL